MPRIDIIGTHYNKEDQFSEDGCVIACDGISFMDAEKQNNFNIMVTYMIGDKYMDGIIVDCFCHPESDCIWAIIKCLDVYFSVEFYHTGKYNMILSRENEDIKSNSGREHIKDSTELSGGHLW